MTEFFVEWALSAVFTEEPALDEGRAGRGGRADAGRARTRVLEHTDLAVLAHVVLVTDAGVAALLGHAGALVLARIGVAHVHLDVADVVILLASEAQWTLAGMGFYWVNGSEQNTLAINEMFCGSEHKPSLTVFKVVYPCLK